MKIKATPSEGPTEALLRSVPPACSSHHRPTPPPGTPGHSWASLGHLWGHCSFLLGPGAHKVLFVPSKSLCPQSCVSSGGSMVGLLATSSQRAYATPRSAAPRAPAPAAGHCQPTPPLEIPGDSQASLGQSLVGSLLLSPGSDCSRFCLCPPRVSFQVLCKFWQLYGEVSRRY